MKFPAIIAILGVACGPVSAYEPDVTQERMEYDTGAVADHLVPDGAEMPRTGPRFYIAQFGRYPSFEDSFEWHVTLKDGKYILSSWRLAHASNQGKTAPHLDELTVQISKELANTIYSIWANGILDARFSRHPEGLDGTTYWFSTYLRGAGWPSATTWNPSAELPPKWLVNAGESVLAFARAKPRDPAAVLTKLKAIGEQLSAYRLSKADVRTNTDGG